MILFRALLNPTQDYIPNFSNPSMGVYPPSTIRKSAMVKITKIAQLETLLGRTLAQEVIKLRTSNMKRLPTYVDFKAAKPSFCLNDGDTLHAYAVDLVTNEITNNKYCGSNDSAYMHQQEQFAEGHTAPENKAFLFISKYWNGKNTSWDLTIISSNYKAQIS